MTDRRYFRAAGGVAHDSLRGALDGVLFVSGRWMRVAVPLTDLCATPGGARDRQMLLGTRFCVITECDGHAFGFDEDEGYCGWIAESALGPDAAVTHWVAAPATHVYPVADIKQRESMALSLGARLAVTGEADRFALTPLGHVPAKHLRPIGAPRDDAIAVAAVTHPELFEMTEPLFVDVALGERLVRGQTVLVRGHQILELAGPRTTRVCTDLDGARFRAMFLQALARAG